jgi:hypothetical protein
VPPVLLLLLVVVGAWLPVIVGVGLGVGFGLSIQRLQSPLRLPIQQQSAARRPLDLGAVDRASTDKARIRTRCLAAGFDRKARGVYFQSNRNIETRSGHGHTGLDTCNKKALADRSAMMTDAMTLCLGWRQGFPFHSIAFD